MAAIMVMYSQVETVVQMEGETPDSFLVKVGVHQGSILSPLLFNIVLDEIAKVVNKEQLMELLYADDLVLVGRTLDEVKEKFSQWKEALEQKGLKVNLSKTKIMKTSSEAKTKEVSQIDPCSVCGLRVKSNSILCLECNKWVHKRCSGIKGSLLKQKDSFRCRKCLGQVQDDSYEIEKVKDVTVGADRIEAVDRFCYLGDMIDGKGDADAAVTARIRSGWKKFRDMSGVLCRKGMSLRMKGELYKACVRSAMIYGSETWAMKEEQKRRLETNEMRMLRMICGVTLRDRISNEEIRSRVHVAPLGTVITRNRLRWFGHVVRREDESLIKQALDMRAQRRGRGRPKLRWEELVSRDMRVNGLSREDAMNREYWRVAIRDPANPCKQG